MDTGDRAPLLRSPVPPSAPPHERFIASAQSVYSLEASRATPAVTKLDAIAPPNNIVAIGVQP
jgi:hypothetical protein